MFALSLRWTKNRYIQLFLLLKQVNKRVEYLRQTMEICLYKTVALIYHW